MALIDLKDITLSFGGRPVLENAGLQIDAGERVGLVGRNGEGKSTLLKVVDGSLRPDSGIVARGAGVRTSVLDQKVPDGLDGTVSALVESGLDPHAGEHHHIDRLCSLLDLDGARPIETLSGGEKRRALLGRALASDPDILILDEPTNHLDLASIEWMETYLQRSQQALLFVTHDRMFLQRVATRILELDRGRLSSWPGDYETYLKRKEEFLASEEKQWAEFDKTLAQEEAWIRRGIKARRTRNEGRVRALKKLRVERAERRQRVDSVRMEIDAGERSGREVLVAKKLSFSYGDQTILRDFSTTVTRGDKIGIIGPNGSGKTTLVRILLGALEPDAGTVKHGTSLQVSYFDQHREQLDEDASVADNAADGLEYVHVGGEKRHVMSYLQDFLFPSERAREPVRSLSGGERNRLLLARLFTRPANLLVLDEPTNDLDAETLELLEARLVEFDGTVLVVSHDRAFLDNLCTSTLVFDGNGRVEEHAGGYSDWQRVVERRRSQQSNGSSAVTPENEAPAGASARRAAKRAVEPGGRRRLSYKEKREWEALPALIESMEDELEKLNATMSDPEFFRGDDEVIRQASERARALPVEIEGAYARWEELDARAD